MKINIHETINSIGVVFTLGLTLFAFRESQEDRRELPSFTPLSLQREAKGVTLVATWDEIKKTEAEARKRMGGRGVGTAVACNCTTYEMKGVKYQSTISNGSDRTLSIVRVQLVYWDRFGREEFTVDRQTRDVSPKPPINIGAHESEDIEITTTMGIEIPKDVFGYCRRGQTYSEIIWCFVVEKGASASKRPENQFLIKARFWTSTGHMYEVPVEGVDSITR